MSRILSRTNVGSHMWGMERPDSDIDLFEIYLEDTAEILLGRDCKSYCTKIPCTPPKDIAGHELGKAMNMVIRGNVNFVWGVFSPIVETTTKEFEQLKKLAELNTSKLMYKSIHGMSKHNIEHLNQAGLTEKKARTILRTIDFGINFLQTGTYKFKKNTEELPGDYKSTVGVINQRLQVLEYSLKISPLPELPEFQDEANDWLIKVRLKELGVN